MLRLPIVAEKATCAACGGKCCETAPGEVWPADVAVLADGGVDWNRVATMLRSGRYCVDWWEGEPSEPYLRPAIVGHEGEVTHAGWGGRCTFLGPGGCDLSDEDRPTGCRQLVPGYPEKSCNPAHGAHPKWAAKEAWEPWAERLWAVAAECHEQRAVQGNA